MGDLHVEPNDASGTETPATQKYAGLAFDRASTLPKTFAQTLYDR
jgi:hypothetical protein